MSSHAKQQKRAANAEYAGRFRRRNRALRRQERHQRRERREREWLAHAGIERDMSHPLVRPLARRRKRKR